MATAAQFAANRANARKSTGPRTEQGKSHSRLNAIDHNLTGTRCLRATKEQAAFEAYSDRILPSLFRQSLAPLDELQLETARRIVSTMFRLAQVPVIEANMVAAVRDAENAGFDENQALNDVTNAMALGKAFLQNSRDFSNLSLYEQRLSRGLQKDLDLLRQLQRAATAQSVTKPRPAAAKPAAQPIDPITPDPEIGFVYATASAHPAPPPPAASEYPETRAA
jgi:hypothetical protein